MFGSFGLLELVVVVIVLAIPTAWLFFGAD